MSETEAQWAARVVIEFCMVIAKDAADCSSIKLACATLVKELGLDPAILQPPSE